MIKKLLSLLFVFAMGLALLTGCQNMGAAPEAPHKDGAEQQIAGTRIELSDTAILVDAKAASEEEGQAVYVAHDIVYYEAGHDFTYGEGTKEEEHSREEADKHVVVHITQPGNYVISGSLSAGQIAVDLGEDAKEDPQAVVNLYLNGVSITNTVAPAVIFYRAYEPFHDVSEETAAKDVDTSAAGANVFVVDGTLNRIEGSHVARIYKPGSVVLSEDGTKVVEEKKLHKYDGAFYSRVTMNIYGGKDNTGVLQIKADNEGLDSEMHLTIHGGILELETGNDGINTNEDRISVTTVNGGEVHILVNGSTGEGDGIDSNGWLVINGGTVTAQACGSSMDSGVDSDLGIHIQGGTVIASGNMLDEIAQSAQTYAVFRFSKALGAGVYCLKDAQGSVVLEQQLKNSFTSLIISSDVLAEGDYTLWYQDEQLVGTAGEGGMFGGFGGGRPGGMPEGTMPPEMPEGMPEGRTPPEMPEGFDPGRGRPEGEEWPPAGFEGGRAPFETDPDGKLTLPDGTAPDGGMPGGEPREEWGAGMPEQNAAASGIFTIRAGANHFSVVGKKEPAA